MVAVTGAARDEAVPSRISAELRRARGAVFGAFAVQGLGFSLLVSRVPALQKQVHASDGTLTLLLAVVPIVAGCGSVLSEQLVRRSSSGTVLRIAEPLVLIALIFGGLSHSVGAVLPALALFGLAVGAVDATSNMQAVALQRRYGRSILLAFHGTWTAGAITGSLMAAGFSSAHWKLSALYVTGAIVGIPVLLAIGPRFLKGVRDETVRTDVERDPIPWRPMLGICAIMTLAYLGDSTVANAGGKYITDGLHGSSTTSALTYGTYATTLMIGRLAGDKLVRRFGGPFLARLGSAVGVVGLVIAIVAPGPVVALGGFAVLGFGLAVMVPLAFTAAGRHDPEDTGVAVARINVFNYLGFLLGAPLVVGLWSAGVPHRVGLVVPAVLVAGIAFLANGFAEHAEA